MSDLNMPEHEDGIQGDDTKPGEDDEPPADEGQRETPRLTPPPPD